MFLRQTGPSLSPFNAWVMLKGLETLALRVEKAAANAAKIADFLADHPKVTRAIYPFRPDHPHVALARKQMTAGSTLVTFDVRGGKAEAFRFGGALEIVKITNNLGDAKSLITHPATTTHQRLTPEARAELGIGDSMLRLSVGIEDADDLIEDISIALDAI
jgi:O-succinylhomoserine sulfhydrylase